MTLEPDEREPSAERQGELARAYDRYLHGPGSFRDRIFAIRTAGELRWLMGQRHWTGELDQQATRRIDLSGVSFAGINLRGAHLYCAGLRDSTFSRADLSGAILIAADLMDTVWYRARLVGTHLAAAYLPAANLEHARLNGAMLQSADLSHACLRQASLRDATLFGADLQFADLSGADLRGAQLRGARFNEHTKLTNVRFDAHTQLESGMLSMLQHSAPDSAVE